MTVPVATGRPRRSGWGWLVVVVGWLTLALTPVLFVATGAPPAIIAIVSVVLVAGGCLLIGARPGGKIAFVVIPTLFFGGFATAVGMGLSAEQFVFMTAGKTATCQITAVHKLVSTSVITDGNGRSTTSYDVTYQHTAVCPQATYTVDRVPPYSIGTRAKVTYDPNGRVGPRFTDRVGGVRTVGLIALSVGALILLAAPFAARSIGRRGTGLHPAYPPQTQAPYPGQAQAPYPQQQMPYPDQQMPHPPGQARPFDPSLDQQVKAALGDVRSGRKIAGLARLMQLGMEERRAQRPPGQRPPGQRPPEPPPGP